MSNNLWSKVLKKINMVQLNGTELKIQKIKHRQAEIHKAIKLLQSEYVQLTSSLKILQQEQTSLDSATKHIKRNQVSGIEPDEQLVGKSKELNLKRRSDTPSGENTNVDPDLEDSTDEELEEPLKDQVYENVMIQLIINLSNPLNTTQNLKCSNYYLQYSSYSSSTIVTNEEMKKRMIGRQFIPLRNIQDQVHEDEIEGDWVTIGIVFNIQSYKNKTNDTNQIVNLIDFNNNTVRLFLIGFHMDFVIGNVIAILNPSIVLPSEVIYTRLILVDEWRNWVGIEVTPFDYDFRYTLTVTIIRKGMSVDMGFCKGYLEQKCSKVVDKSITLYCLKHQTLLYQRSRNKRQEFATGNSLFSIGAPTNKSNRSTKVQRSFEKNATYNINGEIIVCEGDNVKHHSPLKPTIHRHRSKVEKDELESILNSDAPGANPVRLSFGFQKPSAGSANIFGSKALAKLGFNPFNQSMCVTKMILTIDGNSPQKNVAKEKPIEWDSGSAEGGSQQEKAVKVNAEIIRAHSTIRTAMCHKKSASTKKRPKIQQAESSEDELEII
ncbi:hypothetical protein HDV02_002556 [Globomyces sp. JEL0801]|nr:hypothetical protein HDV02_002556 [Globomyces sp. JEL0801]